MKNIFKPYPQAIKQTDYLSCDILSDLCGGLSGGLGVVPSSGIHTSYIHSYRLPHLKYSTVPSPQFPSPFLLMHISFIAHIYYIRMDVLNLERSFLCFVIHVIFPTILMIVTMKITAMGAADAIAAVPVLLNPTTAVVPVP